MWLTAAQATKLVSRSRRTLQYWRQLRLLGVKYAEDDGAVLYDDASLVRARQLMDKRHANRRIVPGTGMIGYRCPAGSPKGLIPLWEEEDD